MRDSVLHLIRRKEEFDGGFIYFINDNFRIKVCNVDGNLFVDTTYFDDIGRIYKRFNPQIVYDKKLSQWVFDDRFLFSYTQENIDYILNVAIKSYLRETNKELFKILSRKKREQEFCSKLLDKVFEFLHNIVTMIAPHRAIATSIHY